MLFRSNLSMGEGGALFIKEEAKIEEGEIIREKGTNRSKFFRGEVDKYTWVNYGSSYLPSDLNAAYLWGQMEEAEKIQENRMNMWKAYYALLKPLEEEGFLSLPVIPEGCVHNAHMFYLKLKNIEERDSFNSFLKEKGILSVFHYIPLHSAPAGRKYGRFHGEDKYTTVESQRLTRLPLYYGLKEYQVEYIATKIKEFFKK